LQTSLQQTKSETKATYNVKECSKPGVAVSCLRLIFSKAEISKLVHNLCTFTTINAIFRSHLTGLHSCIYLRLSCVYSKE